MKVHQGLPEEGLPGAVVTLGTFDGVHLGHRRLLQEMQATARQHGTQSVLLTFWPHPRHVLQPDAGMKLLNTLDEKLDRLAEDHIDHVVIVPFTHELSKYTYLDFFKKYIQAPFQPRAMVIGHDHHFGKNREGSFEELKELSLLYNFGLHQVSAASISGETVSSTKVRNALLEGRVAHANVLLGYEYRFSGTVVHGDKIGRTLGFPTANIGNIDPVKLMPGDGIYMADVLLNGESHSALLSLGTRPTVEGKDFVAEAHLLAYEADLYDMEMTVVIKEHIRNQLIFASLEDLKEQMEADKALALKYFKQRKEKLF